MLSRPPKLEIAGLLVAWTALIPAAAMAQITPDATLGAESSRLRPGASLRRGGTADLIEGGATRGANLFHSFSEFNVDDGQRVYFANPDGIANILSRVTGANASNIRGTLGVDGAANLFFLNPNGINFGPNARLDLLGSFMATTGNDFLFPDGFTFGATNPQSPSLLSVSVPVGVQYGGRTPGAIEVDGSILAVDSGKSLTLTGGTIRLDNALLETIELATGNFPADGGRVELGAASAGTVGINQIGDQFSLSFPDSTLRSDISITNDSALDVVAENRGDISIYARNLEISNESQIRAGIRARGGFLGSRAGNVSLNAIDSIEILQDSQVTNRVNDLAIGDAGDITLQAGTLNLLDNSLIGSNTGGFGNAGDISITAIGTINVVNSRVSGENFWGVTEAGIGDAGNVDIQANSLSLIDSTISGTVGGGVGNAGDVSIRIADTVNLNGGIISSYVGDSSVGAGGEITIQAQSLSMRASGILTYAYSDGDSGNITINTDDSISLVDDSYILSEVSEGETANGGKISLSTGNLFLTDSQLSSSTEGNGDAGDIIVNAQNMISLERSEIFSGVGSGGVGSGGDITINTGSLSATGDSRIQSRVNGETFSSFIGVVPPGQGDAGNIAINASGDVTFNSLLDSEDSDTSTGVFSTIDNGVTGNGGNISITANSLYLNGAKLSTSTSGQGNAGNITINAYGSTYLNRGGFIDSDVETNGRGNSGEIKITAGNSVLLDTLGLISTSIRAGAIGHSGNIEIDADSVSIANGSQLQTFLRDASDDLPGGQGSAGNITINARNTVSVDGELLGEEVYFRSGAMSTVGERARGNGGNIRITAGSLFVTNGAKLDTSTHGQGNAGSIRIVARDAVSFTGSSQVRFGNGALSVVAITGEGNGGNISIDTGSLSIKDGAQIDAFTVGQGSAGSITINARDSIFMSGQNAYGVNSGIFNSVAGAGIGNGGTTNVFTDSLNITNGSSISAETNGQGNAGIININADSLSVTQRGSISTLTTTNGRAGSIILNADQVRLEGNGTGLFARTETNSSGRGGAIQVTADHLDIHNQAEIAVGSQGAGQAGNLEITADVVNLINQGRLTAETNTATGGNIDLQISDSLTLNNNSQISASTQTGQAGRIRVNFDQAPAASIQLSNSSISSRATSTGDAGAINLNTANLTARNNSEISASTISGSSGEIRLRGLDALTVNNSQIAASTETGRAGSLIVEASDSVQLRGRFEGRPAGLSVQARGEGGIAGNLTIQTDRLSIQESAAIVASTTSGQGGAIRLDQIDRLILNNGQISASTQDGRAGQISFNFDQTPAEIIYLLNNSEITSRASGDGNAGSISLNSRSIALQNRSEISAATISGIGGDIRLVGLNDLQLDRSQISASTQTGQAGGIEVRAADSVQLRDQASISVEARGTGSAGNLTMMTDRLTVSDRSSVTVSSPEGLAGNLTATASTMVLDNGELTAETGRTRGQQGANIRLQDLDLLLLRNGSQIFADANNNANGGNVAIDSALITAIPSEDSNIRANAIQGQGGAVNIMTEGILGIQPALQPISGVSDITASSEQGVQGTVTINTPNVDPSQGLVELPTTVVDAAQQINQTCPTGVTTEEPNRFVRSGRSGLPPTPSDPIDSRELAVEWYTPTEASANVTASLPADIDPIIEAQGWVKYPDGSVEMVAAAAPNQSNSPAFLPVSCHE